LQQLDRNEQLPHDTLLKVFRLGQTPCPPTCGTKGSKGSKDNPECFHGLMPAEGSFRKKGLWQKEPVLGQLGHDPADDKRQVSSTQHCSSTTAAHSMLRRCHLVTSMRLFSLLLYSQVQLSWRSPCGLVIPASYVFASRRIHQAFKPLMLSCMFHAGARCACWPAQPGQHLLRERSHAVPASNPGVQARAVRAGARAGRAGCDTSAAVRTSTASSRQPEGMQQLQQHKTAGSMDCCLFVFWGGRYNGCVVS
jgi:hypothetical protein